MKRKLSVIVPVYNMAADNKLEYCMDSLVRQTVEDMEIIAVDDASTDNSLEILRRYERIIRRSRPACWMRRGIKGC